MGQHDDRHLRHLVVGVAAGVCLGLTGCGSGEPANAATPEPFTVALPSREPLTRSEIDELKTQLEDPVGDPAEIVLPASVFAFDDDRPSTRHPEWENLIAVLGAVRETALSNGWVLVIDGYTDAIGDATYNQGLSKRRAIAAKAEIVATAHYPEERVFAFGRGEGGSNESDRRVVVHFQREERSS